MGKLKKPSVKKTQGFIVTSTIKPTKTKTKEITVQSKIKTTVQKPKEKTASKNVEDPFKQFNIKITDVKQALKGVVKIVSTNSQKQLFNEDAAVFLQINPFKIPKIKGNVKKVFRIPLEHSILPEKPDICLIVPDVKGIKNDEHEQHLEHYEKLLETKNVTGIKKIMTFHEFRTEYDTYELKRRFVDLYDVFLVDGKISGKVVHKCGKIFYDKRKLPIAIKLAATKLKNQIETSLKKVFFQMQWHGGTCSVQVGHIQMPVSDLADNIHKVVTFLNTHFPGKLENIRSLNIYAHKGSNIPIYLSLRNPNEVKVPVVSSKKLTVIKTEVGELTTQYNATVKVKPDGKIIVKRGNQKSKEAENVEEESESEPTNEINEDKKLKKRFGKRKSDENLPPKKKKKSMKSKKM